jgi:hypothetical protein
MGTGAIVLLVVMAVMAMVRSNNRMAVEDTSGAIVTGVLFAFNVGILVLGNPWVWAGWMAGVAAKTLFMPSDETLRERLTMPDGVFAISLVVSVLVNGLLFMAFQWLR